MRVGLTLTLAWLLVQVLPAVSQMTSPSGPLEAAWGARVSSTAMSQSTGRSIALGIYRPVFPDDLSAVESYEQVSGQQMAIVHWYTTWGGWKQEFNRADLERVSARGSVPMITWEPWAGPQVDGVADPAWTLRAAILSGQNDAYIDSWARGLAAYGQPVLLRFAHEMHHQRYAWAVGVNGNTAEDYVAAWRHVRAIFARYDTSNVQWVWTPNTIGPATAATYLPLYQSLYPGDDYVDWIGLDIFNTGPHLDWGAPYWRNFSEVLSEPYTAVTALTTKPVLLAEVGSAETGGSKAAWITDALTVQLATSFPRVHVLVWFDTNKEHEEQWALTSSREALEAWVAGARDPLFRVDPFHPIWGQRQRDTPDHVGAFLALVRRSSDP
jgi:hypothetical protein